MGTEQYVAPVIKSVVLACLLTFLLQALISFFTPLSSSPGLLHFPPPTTWNNELQKVTKLGEGVLKAPEDICVDPKDGSLYTATRDGWIKKMHRNGTWEDWKHLDSDSLLGITMSSTPGHILVCDATHGLLKVSKDEVTVLSSHFNGTRIIFADDVKEASDGKIYFSDASAKFGFGQWYDDVLEAIPSGRLFMYDPATKETSLLLDHLAFANGVAISKEEDYVVICETWKLRCLKYFLKGDDKGKTEIFIDNLPAGPDNIKVAPDGTFWIALVEVRLNGLDFIHKMKTAKQLVATFPSLIRWTRDISKKAKVINVGADGKILKKFDDSNGKVISWVTSVLEFEDHIYLGNLNTDFIGKLPLK